MIGKILGALQVARQTLRSPAGQVTVAATLIGIAVRIGESMLTDLVDVVHTQQALAGGDRQAIGLLHNRLTLMEKAIGTLYDERRAAREVTADAGTEDPGDVGTEVPAGVEGWAPGRDVRVVASETTEPIPGVRVTEFTALPD